MEPQRTLTADTLPSDQHHAEYALESFNEFYRSIDRAWKLWSDYLTDALNWSNCLGIWDLANQHSIKSVQESALTLILGVFGKVIKGEEFKNISADTLAKLLASDEINIHSEEQAFEALTIWIDHYVDDRKAAFPKLFNCIRVDQLKREVSSVS